MRGLVHPPGSWDVHLTPLPQDSMPQPSWSLSNNTPPRVALPQAPQVQLQFTQVFTVLSLTRVLPPCFLYHLPKWHVSKTKYDHVPYSHRALRMQMSARTLEAAFLGPVWYLHSDFCSGALDVKQWRTSNHLPRPAGLCLPPKPSLLHSSSLSFPGSPSWYICTHPDSPRGQAWWAVWLCLGESPPYLSAHLLCGISSWLPPFYRRQAPLERVTAFRVGRVSPHQGLRLDFPGYSLTDLIRSGRRPASRVPISKKGLAPSCPLLQTAPWLNNSSWVWSGAGSSRRDVRLLSTESAAMPGTDSELP